MYQFLTGKFPFEGATPFQMAIAFDHAVLTFPKDLAVTKECLDLIRGLLQVDPAKRIDWPTFFSCNFVSSEPKEHGKFIEASINNSMLDSAMNSDVPIDTSMDKLEKEYEIILVKEINKIRLKTNVILQTFYDKNRVLVIDTCTKEIFDVLWKLSKRLKPIVGFFAPKSKALVFQNDRRNIDKPFFMKLININGSGKEELIPLTQSIIHRVQRNENFKAQVDNLIAEYETIVNNLVGYAEIVPLMTKYDSLWNLFKYTIALGHEGSVYELDQKDKKGAGMKYFQSFLMIELILSEIYNSDKNQKYKSDPDCRDCIMIDENGNMAGQQYTGKNVEVEKTLKIKEIDDIKINYLRKLRNELKARCLKTKSSETVYSVVFSEGKSFSE